MTGPQPRALLYSTTGTVPLVLRNVIDGRVQVTPTPPEKWGRTDYYLTTSGLCAATERAAARLGAIPVVMPEGHSWLNAQLLTSPWPKTLFLARKRGDSP